MRILHISDSHSLHREIIIPENIDMIIHTGDCSNYRDPYKNEQEVRDFLEWYGSIDVKYKLYIAGNHDTSIEKRLVSKFDFQSKGIIYLENDFVEIEGLKIWGSPITPSFFDWAFMKSRDKLHKVWSSIPDDTDIVAIHGPAKGILDTSFDRSGKMEFCGCNALRNRIFDVNPKLFLFGHIHDMVGVHNAGTRTVEGYRTIFSNGTLVMDGKFNRGIIHKGNIFEV